MALTAAGRWIATKPDPRLFFSHSWIGEVLVALNTLAPGWNWYGFYLVTVQCVALLGIAYAVQLRENGWSSVVLYVVFFVGFGIEFLNKLQFTSASYLCGVAGFAVMTAALDVTRTRQLDFGGEDTTCSTHSSSRLLGARLLFGSALLLLAFLIRWMCIPLILLLCAPLGVASWARHRMDRQNRELAAVMSVILLVAAMAWWYDLTDAARGADWNAGRHRQWVITDFIDYRKLPYDASTKVLYEQVGWSRADYELVMNYAVPKEPKFDYSSLKFLSDHHVQHVEWRFSVLAGAFLGTIAMIARTPVSGYCVAIAAVLLALRSSPKFDRMAAWLTLPLAAVTLLSLLLFKNRVPEWVFLPVAGHMLFSAIFATTGGRSGPSRSETRSGSEGTAITGSTGKPPLARAVTSLLWGLVVVASLWLTHRQYLENRQVLQRQKRFSDDLAAVAAFRPKLLVIHGSVPFSLLSATHLSLTTQSVPSACLGPSDFYPPAQDVLRQSGINDPLAAMATEGDILLLSATTGILESLHSKWRESQGIDCVFQMVYRGDEFTAFRAQATRTDRADNLRNEAGQRADAEE